MKLNFQKLLEFVFPLSDDERCLASCTAEQFSQKLRIARKAEICTLTDFADAHVRSAIHLVKFHNHTRACALLGEVLEHWLRQLPPEEYVLIPIPLSTARMRERGHNQVETIARRATANLPNVHVCTSALVRIKHTKRQTSLARKARHENVSGAFTLRDNANVLRMLRNKHVILLDDVCTTGATLHEAHHACSTLPYASLTRAALAR